MSLLPTSKGRSTSPSHATSGERGPVNYDAAGTAGISSSSNVPLSRQSVFVPAADPADGMASSSSLLPLAAPSTPAPLLQPPPPGKKRTGGARSTAAAAVAVSTASRRNRAHRPDLLHALSGMSGSRPSSERELVGDYSMDELEDVPLQPDTTRAPDNQQGRTPNEWRVASGGSGGGGGRAASKEGGRASTAIPLEARGADDELQFSLGGDDDDDGETYESNDISANDARRKEEQGEIPHGDAMRNVDLSFPQHDSGGAGPTINGGDGNEDDRNNYKDDDVEDDDAVFHDDIDDLEGQSLRGHLQHELPFEPTTKRERTWMWTSVALVVTLTIVSVSIAVDWIDWPGDGLGNN